MRNSLENIKPLINKIKQIDKANQFKKYIDFIQFPYYRNLEPNTRITFDFPYTVFVGPNGSGKSSTLHAIQGCPEGYTPYRFWFDTKVDPIEYYDEKKRRHSFFYSFKNDNGKEFEVVKARIARKDNPNYWETSRPLKWAGMKSLPKGKQRNDPIRKNVIYIDFRSELSAFDKYFYFGKPGKNLKAKNKQEYLRHKAKYLKRVIDNPNEIIELRGVSQNEPVKEISKNELEWISYILGREYLSGKIIKHKFFKDWGISVIFETDHATYSEAFAGSGETAIVKLVHEVLNAKHYSLIILDEPEVSLHPGAQNRFKLFLLKQIKLKKHQVVLSTHSPEFVKGIPPEAIKVFTQNIETNKFKIISNLTPDEAFYHIELQNPNKKTIIVEDDLAQSIVETVINEMGDDVKSNFEITFYHGGHSTIKTDFIKVFCQENIWNKFILFDGDQKIIEQHYDPSQMTEAELTEQQLKEEIKRQTNVEVKFKPDSNRHDQIVDMMKNYLNYYLTNVFYLPERVPEEIIWNQSLAEDHLKMFNKTEVINKIKEENNFKEKFLLLTKELYNDSKKIKATYAMFLNYWCDHKDENFQKIRSIINKIRSL
ncbi:MAG: ATP-dependent nuclease [Candidatus Woesearchaeota archaeon]